MGSGIRGVAQALKCHGPTVDDMGRSDKLGTLFWVPFIRILLFRVQQGTILGSPIFGNPHINPALPIRGVGV